MTETAVEALRERAIQAAIIEMSLFTGNLDTKVRKAIERYELALRMREASPMPSNPETADDKAEAEYIRVSDLTKLRIVDHILSQVTEGSLKTVEQIRHYVRDAIRDLEGNFDDE